MDYKVWWMLEYSPFGGGHLYTKWYRYLEEAVSYLPERAFISKVFIKDPDKGVICIAETQEDVQRLFK